MQDLGKVLEIKESLNKKLSDLSIDIKVDANFIIILMLLLDELKDERP